MTPTAVLGPPAARIRVLQATRRAAVAAAVSRVGHVATAARAGREQRLVRRRGRMRGAGRDGEVGGAVGRQGDTIILGPSKGPWLGSHGAGRECRHPEADGADVLAQVAGALAILAGAVLLVGHVVQTELGARDREERAPLVGVALL